MPQKKTHVTYTRLSDKHLNNFLGNKSFTVKPSDHNNEHNHVVELHYNAKKHMNKLHRNLAKGSGTRILPHELHDIKIENGKGFFDSIRNAFNRVGDVAKKVFNSPVTKQIVKTVAPIATKMASDAIKSGVTAYTGNPALGEVAGNLGQQGLQTGTNAYTGSGIKRVTGSGIKLGFANPNPIKRSGGSFAPLSGGSIKAKKGGAIESQQFQGVGTTPGLQALNPNDKMARIRSFRGGVKLS